MMSLLMLGRSWKQPKIAVRQLGEPNKHTFGKVRILQTSDGQEYVCKANEWCDATHLGRIHQVANEILCADLAARVGVPVPPNTLLEWEGVRCFASELQHIFRNFLPRFLSQTDNASDIYRIVAFDAWILNCDRHEGNLIIAKAKDNTIRLFAIDHGHCPLAPSMQPGSLSEQRNMLVAATLQSFLRPCVPDRGLLHSAIDVIQDVSDDTIRALVHDVPFSGWSNEEESQIADFLVYRRDILKELFEAVL